MEDRFVALANELIARGLLDSYQGQGRAVSLLQFQLGPPPTAVPTFSAGATAQEVASVNALIAGWGWTPRRLRDLYLIWKDVELLSAAQQQNIWTAITTPGSIWDWTRHRGVNDAAMLTLHWAATTSTTTAAEKNDARRRLVSMMAEDRPTLLVNPTFDPTINVPGDQPA